MFVANYKVDFEEYELIFTNPFAVIAENDTSRMEYLPALTFHLSAQYTEQMPSELIIYSPIWIMWVVFTGACNGAALLQCAQIFWSARSFNVSHTIKVSRLEEKAKKSLYQQSAPRLRRKRARESIFDFDMLEGNCKKRKKISSLFMESNFRHRRCHSLQDYSAHSTRAKVIRRTTSFDDKSSATITSGNATSFLPMAATNVGSPNAKKLPERLKDKITQKLENVLDEAICSFINFLVYTTLIHLLRTHCPFNIGVSVDIGPVSIAL